jgi:predicted membrane protein
LFEKTEGFFWGLFYLYGPAYQYLLTVFLEKTYFLQFWGPSFPMVFGVFFRMGSWRWRFCFMFLLVWILDCSN